MRILASDGMDKSAIAALQAEGHEVVEQFYEPAELAEQVKQYDVLVVRSATKVRVPIIDAAKEAGPFHVCNYLSYCCILFISEKVFRLY